MKKEYISPKVDFVVFSSDEFIITSDCDCFDSTDVYCDDCKYDD